MILRNARCIFAEGIRDGLELVVRAGKIAEIREQTRRADDEVVDLAGDYLAPGFIDLHVHGAVGHDTMEASADAFRAICEFHASGGSTSLLLTTASAPLDAIVSVLDSVRDCRHSIPQIAGVHVEGPFISKNKAGAHRAEFIQHPTSAAVARLLERVDVIKRITIAPELPGAVEAVQKFAAAGISVSGGHSDSSDEQARAAFARGMRSVTHTFNCMSSARRDGIYRRGGLLEFALSEPEISCELIADGHHVSATLMKVVYRAKGANGICIVTDATAGAGLNEAARFSLYGNECIVERGVCLLADRSALAGSAARMIDLVRTLVHNVGVPLHEVIATATQNPASAIGLESKGALRNGADADLVVLSPTLVLRRAFFDGREIFASDRQ